VEQRHDQAVVVGKEEAGAVELDERSGLHVRLRSWRGRGGT
jgi:phage head maturation protease